MHFELFGETALAKPARLSLDLQGLNLQKRSFSLTGLFCDCKAAKSVALNARQQGTCSTYSCIVSELAVLAFFLLLKMQNLKKRSFKFSKIFHSLAPIFYIQI